MSKVALNELFKMQKEKLVQATFKKAVINAVNIQNSTADVFFAENPQTIIRSVPFAANIIPSLIMVGDRCRVDVFDETNTNDMVVAYVYGRSFKLPLTTLFNSGTGLIASGGGNSVTVAHGLVDENGNGVVPDLYIVVPTSFAYYGPTTTTYFFTVTSVDNTNIHFDRIPDNTISVNYQWFVVKFRS